MKKTLITTGILLILLGIVYTYRVDIANIFNKYVINNIIRTNKVVTLNNKNSYYRNYDYNFVKQTASFSPKDSDDLINIYYTVINAGEKEFTFYCPKEYDSCLSDVKVLANDQNTLSHINNFVHPYNSFTHIETEYDSFGKIKIHINKTYTDEEIKKIDEKVDEIISSIIKDDMSLKDKIKAFHDYIIEHSKYDTDRSDKNIIKYKSDTAYGTLFEGYSLCGGYTDTMAIFLNKLDVNNYKVSSDSHVWNAVELDGIWYHIDLTWDDPVASDGSDILDHDYFIISTEDLENKEKTQHVFDKNIYSEV